jgi:UTP:GlnB (protein PII) uridylyltransferase
MVTIDPIPHRRTARVSVRAGDVPGSWVASVVARDRAGLLAATASALLDLGLDTKSAQLAVWPDGAALQHFDVAGTRAPEPDDLERRIALALAAQDPAVPIEDLHLRFDNQASPWHTVCEVDGAERRGLLADLGAIFRDADVVVRSATASSHADRVYDVFELVTSRGAKLDDADQDRIASLVRDGTPARRRGRRRRSSARSQMVGAE